MRILNLVKQIFFHVKRRGIFLESLKLLIYIWAVPKSRVRNVSQCSLVSKQTSKQTKTTLFHILPIYCSY